LYPVVLLWVKGNPNKKAAEQVRGFVHQMKVKKVG